MKKAVAVWVRGIANKIDGSLPKDAHMSLCNSSRLSPWLSLQPKSLLTQKHACNPSSNQPAAPLSQMLMWRSHHMMLCLSKPCKQLGFLLIWDAVFVTPGCPGSCCYPIYAEVLVEIRLGMSSVSLLWLLSTSLWAYIPALEWLEGCLAGWSNSYEVDVLKSVVCLDMKSQKELLLSRS